MPQKKGNKRKDPLNDTERMILDPKCKANMIRRISRNICRNNCSNYNNQKRECKLGYNFKPKNKDNEQ